MAQTPETYLYAQKDTCALYLDIHRPEAGVATEYEGVPKPAILYLFGGGFFSGARNEPYLLNYYRTLTANGYTVVAIDYRLGMKGYKVGKGLIGLAKATEQFVLSQQMGVEDVFSAVTYLAAHPELGIDVSNIVVAGSSAGAIISLATTYAIANGNLPDALANFRLKGAICFSGAIISAHGTPKFRTAPCSILFFHGMDDRAVAYKHFGMFGKGMWGSSYFAERLRKLGANYAIYRVAHRAHDVAGYMVPLWREQQAWLEHNVMLGEQRIIDATIDNPALPIWAEWGAITPQQMYKAD